MTVSSGRPRGRGRGGFWVLAAATVWGTSGAAAALVPQVSALVVGALTLAVSGIVLCAVMFRRIGAVFRASGAGPLLAVAAGCLGVYILAFFSGMALAGVAVGTVIAIVSAPIVVGAIEAVTASALPGRRWSVAAALTLAGGVLLVTGRQSSVGSPVDPGQLAIGSAVAVLAGIAYAGFTIATSRLILPSPRRPEGLADGPVIGAVQGLTVIPLAVVALVVGVPGVTEVAAWSVLLYIGLVPTAVGYLLYARGLRHVSASTASLLTLFEPVVATLLGVFLIGEVLSSVGWVGLGLAMAGLAAATVTAGAVGVADR
ncbi:EamA family transporter [Herbiconiux sp. KACC 21604]|uniref:DMT family transporter n=1 Tax=unclassified Herbiconiux TaxID=2618217 RepID=UPI00149171C2|nr:EamA family transporter [Herbiconiux sp. SALV-R1]QJU52707.1 EamA family transporter [Herbiconiux sp. SALV-R1]WPO87606.1 EamA family transporter [Herbiconiux sp. KACC 21604]